MLKSRCVCGPIGEWSATGHPYEQAINQSALRRLACSILDASLAYEVHTAHCTEHRQVLDVFLEKSPPKIHRRVRWRVGRDWHRQASLCGLCCCALGGQHDNRVGHHFLVSVVEY
jgi:hypothetical protein